MVIVCPSSEVFQIRLSRIKKQLLGNGSWGLCIAEISQSFPEYQRQVALDYTTQFHYFLVAWSLEFWPKAETVGCFCHHQLIEIQLKLGIFYFNSTGLVLRTGTG